MSDQAEIVRRLVEYVRGGDDGSWPELAGYFEPRLRELAQREAASSAGGETVEQLLQTTCNEARRRFAEFQGANEADLWNWLAGILRQNVKRTAEGGEATTGEGRADVTLRKPAEPAAADGPAAPPQTAFDETLDLPTGATDVDKTLQRPDDGLPAAGSAGPRQPAPHAAPTPKRFGDYEIVDTIARGGMGIVYQARQGKLKRIVALKMILAGQFADQADVERFYTEAEAAARLRHPNIVAIHEVSQFQGQHYFSMDYIEGQSLADVVRENPLPPRAAARYVKVIAEAMHYAHGEGILHRDLKPSNVLLDRTKEPMITDFGLAKHAESQSQLTMSGTIIGTPSYMPPEQASGRIDRIDARSDVYSIGAILYELLTGRPPFRAANPFETIKQVLETEPVSPRTLNPALPADLETICLKCLQKESGRRYATAQELADELKRFMAGEPILARPVGPAERFWRWCRRNPKVATLAAVAVLGFLAAFAGTSIGYVRARVAQRQAEASRDQLLNAINGLYTLMSEQQLLNEPGLQGFREQLLTEAKNLYEDTLSQLGDDPKLQHELGLSYFRLARIMRDLDAPVDAVKPLRSAVEIQQRACRRRPDNPQCLAALADSLNLLGEVLQKSGDLDTASETYEQAIAKREQLVQLAPDEHDFRRQLINSQMNSGLVLKSMADRVAADDKDADSDYLRALRRIREAQAGRKELLEKLPDDVKLRVDFAKGYYNLGDLASRLDQLGEARQFLQNAIEQFDVLLAQDPENIENQYRRALCCLLDGDLKGEKDEQAARRRYLEARQALQRLARENPEVHKYRGALAGVLMRIGESHFIAAEDGQALVNLKEAKEILEQLIAEAPSPDYEYLLDVARTRVKEIEQLVQEPPSDPNGASPE